MYPVSRFRRGQGTNELGRLVLLDRQLEASCGKVIQEDRIFRRRVRQLLELVNGCIEAIPIFGPYQPHIGRKPARHRAMLSHIDDSTKCFLQLSALCCTLGWRLGATGRRDQTAWLSHRLTGRISEPA